MQFSSRFATCPAAPIATTSIVLLLTLTAGYSIFYIISTYKKAPFRYNL
jgi:hypothetical protein